MGIRTSRKKKRIFHVATCRSVVQAERLETAAKQDKNTTLVERRVCVVQITRVYTVVGNHNDDIETWQHAIMKKANNVHADWAVPQMSHVNEYPRSYEEIRAAVAKSRERIPQISGSRAYPSAPIKAQLRAEGFVVR